MKDFDDLFNKYFGGERPKRNIYRKINKQQPERPESIEKMMEMMGRLNSGGFSGLTPNEKNLGKPDTLRTFERDGVSFEEATWDTPFGTIVRITTKEDVEFDSDYFERNNIPFGEAIDEELTLGEQLKMAIKSEDYEEAARIRDDIDKDEGANAESTDDIDDWGF